jgi:pyrimidine-nucleoside phosphorylase
MRAVDIIIKKRDRQELTAAEIDYFVDGFTRDEIPDYQAAAWAMAVLLNGMTPEETTELTLAMVRSGEMLDLTDIVPLAVDKHSTGGVGDKTTLVVEPVVAACGLPVSKMSGRGLGFSGGTLDKLEAIPGYRTDLSIAEFKQQLADIGLVLAGQTADLTPADGKLYALRDVTGTVRSIPLIASSVMSKKIAAGAQAIVLDVKCGLGAFMQTLDETRQLGQLMVKIAHLAGQKAVALLADMNQPLGCAVGNALEVRESIDTLQGGGPPDFREHCLVVASHMLLLGEKAENLVSARSLAEGALSDGSAWKKFTQLVSAQGGDTSSVEQPEKLPAAKLIEDILAPEAGYILGVHARLVGETVVLLGGGRTKKGDTINYGVGIQVHCKVGQKIEKGQPLFTVHADDESSLSAARQQLLAAVSWSPDPVEPLPLFYDVVDE